MRGRYFISKKSLMTWINCYHKPEYIKSFAIHLRKDQTEAEKILREKLKGKKFYWLRFHRQKALFAYRENQSFDRFFIADFYHHTKRLIIELDGAIHNKKETRDYDKLREHLLKKANYNIIRFKNEEVHDNLENVLTKIHEIIKSLE